MIQDDLQRHTVLLVHGEEEKRQHHTDHRESRQTHVPAFLHKEKQRDADRGSDGKTDQLPLGQVEKYLCFDFSQVSGNGYIRCHSASLMRVEYIRPISA